MWYKQSRRPWKAVVYCLPFLHGYGVISSALPFQLPCVDTKNVQQSRWKLLPWWKSSWAAVTIWLCLRYFSTMPKIWQIFSAYFIILIYFQRACFFCIPREYTMDLPWRGYLFLLVVSNSKINEPYCSQNQWILSLPALWDPNASAGIAVLVTSGTLYQQSIDCSSRHEGQENLPNYSYKLVLFSWWYITENFCKHFHHSFPLEFSIGSNITFKVLLYTITLTLSPCFFMF